MTNPFGDIWNLVLFRSGDQEVYLSQVVFAVIFICIGVIAGRFFSSLLGKRFRRLSNMHGNTAHLLQRLSFYLFVIIIVLIALPIAGIPITIFTVLGGAFAIGVGFGAQNLFNNLISGLILMLEKPIRIGDIIEVSGTEGRVEEIGNRCVRVRRGDGIDLIVPNSRFLEDTVINWTLHDGHVRGTVAVGVAYGSDTARTRELLLEAAKSNPRVLQTPPASVIFEDFGDNSLVFQLLFWSEVARPLDLRRLKSELRFRIDELFKEARIEIAYPQRDLHLDTLKPLEIKISQ
jgi:small-conductance mechanosensitive channel